MTIRLFSHAFARHAIVFKSVNSAKCCCYPTGFNIASAKLQGNGTHVTDNAAVNTVSRRYYSEKRQVIQSKSKGSSEVTVGQKVKQASKDATYGGIVILGIGVTGMIFYTIGKELFSSQSPNGVYDRALKLCKNSGEVVDSIGEPIKGYGELTRRGRRRHVSHMLFEREGVPCMRMKFYVEGPFNKGTVHLEVKHNEKGKWEYRYLYVELENYPKKTIVLEDNRGISSV